MQEYLLLEQEEGLRFEPEEDPLLLLVQEEDLLRAQEEDLLLLQEEDLKSPKRDIFSLRYGPGPIWAHIWAHSS